MAAGKRDRVTVTDPYSGVELTVNADSPQAKLWAKTESTSAAPEGDPSETWTNAQLDEYAKANGIDLGGATKKADKLAAIEAASGDSGESDEGSDDEGDE